MKDSPLDAVSRYTSTVHSTDGACQINSTFKGLNGHRWSFRKVVELLGPKSKIRRYTPVYQCPNDGAGCLTRQWWLQATVFFKFWVFVVNTCQALLADHLESSGMATGLLSFSQTLQKNLRSHQIYIKMQKYCKFIIFIFWWKLTIWTSYAGIPAQRIQQMARAKLIRRPTG